MGSDPAKLISDNLSSNAKVIEIIIILKNINQETKFGTLYIKPMVSLFEVVIFLLLYRHKCFTGKYTTRKIHINKNYIRGPSGLFSIISHVSLSMM